MQPSSLAKRTSQLLFLAIIIFYLYGLGHLPLLGPDEPRYAQVAREMFSRGDWITPTLGGHPWFEKPALLYWMMIASYKLFGVSEWAARLGPAVCGLLTVASIWCVNRRLHHLHGSESTDYFETVVVATTMLGLVVFARAASFDIVITMTISWALSFFLLHELSKSQRTFSPYLAGFYGFVGLSLLAKGLVGVVIPFGVVTTYFLVSRSWPKRGVLLSFTWGVPLALVIASLWYGPVIARHGYSFIEEFFVQHHLARFVSNKYHHPQPVYFFPAIILMLTVPWTPFLLDSLMRIRRWNWRNPTDELNVARMFALVWLILPVIFFSFSGSKLPGYILPVLPATALLIGERVSLTDAPSSPRWPLRTTGVLCLLLGLGGVVYSGVTSYVTLTCALVAGVPIFVSGLFAVLPTSRKRSAVLAIGFSIIVMLVVVLNCAAPSLAQRDSLRDLLKLGDARGYANSPVLAQKGDDRSAEFYASGRIVYRADGEPVTIDELSQVEIRKLGEKILVFVPIEYVEQFRREPHVEVIGDNGRMVLLGWTAK